MTTAAAIWEIGICPTPFKVLGQRLKPFTVGHAILFQKLDLEILNGPDDLLLAVLICCHSYREFERRLDSWWFGYWIKLWSWLCWRELGNTERLNAQLASFAAYIEEGRKRPDYRFKTGETPDSRTPFLQHLRVILLSKLGYRPETRVRPRSLSPGP